MSNLHEKFESDRAKTVVCIVPTRSYTQCMTLIFDPKITGVHPLVIHNLHVKFESEYGSVYCAHKVLYIVPKLTLTFDPMTQNQ